MRLTSLRPKGVSASLRPLTNSHLAIVAMAALKSRRAAEAGGEIWVVMDVARDGRKLLFWQNDKYESKVIFAARYRLIYIWHRTITRRGFRTLDGRFITPRIATGTVRVRGRSDNYSALDAARIMTRPRVSSVVKFFMAIAQQLIPARLLLLL